MDLRRKDEGMARPSAVLTLMSSTLILQLLPVHSTIRTDAATDRQIHTLETELARLRMMHDDGKTKLKQLERHLRNYEMIIQSLGIVCQTLTRHRLQFQSDFSEVAQPSKAFKPKVSGIYARSVVSVITPLDSMVVVQVTLYYSTTETHEVIWAYNILGHMIPVKENNTFASTTRDQTDETLGTTLYIDMKHLIDVEYVYVKLLSEFSEVTVLFNKSAILLGGSTTLSPVQFHNEEYLPKVLVVDPDQNATIHIGLHTNLSQLASFVNYIGIDTSVLPNRLLDIESTDNRISGVLEKTSNGFSWQITVDKTLIRKGGMLSVRLVEQMTSGPVLQLHLGKTIYLIPGGSSPQRAPFPRNSLALLSLYRNTGQVIVAKPPISTIWCYAFGNPAPKTSIVKLQAGGKRTVLKGHVFRIGQYDAAEAVVLENITAGDEGQYLCEASNGLNVVSEPLYMRAIP